MSFDFEEILGSPASIIDFHRESTFTGYGPTAAFELRRPGGVLTPFVKLRASVLYGDVEREDLLTGNQTSDWNPAWKPILKAKSVLSVANL